MVHEEFSKSVCKFSIRDREAVVENLTDSPEVRNAARTLKVYAPSFFSADNSAKEAASLSLTFR